MEELSCLCCWEGRLVLGLGSKALRPAVLMEGSNQPHRQWSLQL